MRNIGILHFPGGREQVLLLAHAIMQLEGERPVYQALILVNTYAGLPLILEVNLQKALVQVGVDEKCLTKGVNTGGHYAMHVLML